jgi:molecular chaperone DnaK (HSP70)
MEKNLYGVQELTFNDISTVICSGGGFEMLWTREAVGSMFKHAQVQFYKNTKIVAAEGAALAAALLLGATEGYTIVLEDRHQLNLDIGLISGEDVFLPLVERNAFWWQKHSVRLILVNDEVISGMTLTVASRSAEGDIKPLGDVLLDNLPPRPKGATRLSAQVSFSSNTDLQAKFTDLGFGEMFPGVEYERTVSFNLA